MSFPLIGNGKIRIALENVLKEKRLPHAILIDGDIGTGKHTLASFLSCAAICSGDNIPCEDCNNCRLAKSNNHPDIMVISPEEGKKNISVPQIRELRSNCFIKPHQADSKVFIIDSAHTMNEQAQNALLKILEEPPENTVFILISESKAALLDTILSRCVILSLSTPTLEEATEYILSVGEYNIDDVENVLKETQNNIGKALMVLLGDSDTKTSNAAKEFLGYLLRGNEWGMLQVLTPFEKNRVETDRLFKEIRFCVANEIKKNPKSLKAPKLLKFYNNISELEKSLVTNINLSLLFSILTAQGKNCMTS